MPTFIILLFLAGALLAAEQEAPSPSPDASASPSPSPLASESPASSPSPSPGEDIIPLPPDSGAAETPIVSETEVPGLPKPKPGDPLPDSAFADPNAVLPADTSSTPPAPAGPSPQEIQRKIKVRYQEVKTQVEKDPEVRSLYQKSRAAKTFEDERAALREYYRLLFKKMKKADKDLADRCDLMERSYISRLEQTRLEPTIPLNPPPKPSVLAE